MPVSPLSPAAAGASSTPKLSTGDRGPAVTRLQQQLKAAGFSPGAVDGDFGPGTRAAVVAFQKDRGLVADGIVGPATHGALGRIAGGAPPSPAPSQPTRNSTGSNNRVPAAGVERTPTPPPAAPVATTGLRGWGSDLNISEFLGSTMAGASPLSSAGVTPSQVMKGIRSGDVSVEVPVKAGELAGMTVAPGTTARMALSVKDGNVDFARSRMVFHPPMSGPLGTRVSEIQMRSDGRAEVDIPGLPNALIGHEAPANVGAFMEKLQSSNSIPVKVLGITVADLRGGSGAGGSGSPVDLGQARVSAKNVTFQDGALALGNAGRMRFGPDSKLELSGTLRQLEMKGRVSLRDMDLVAGGTRLSGAEGTADISASWSASGPVGRNGLPSSGTLSARLDNLSFHAESTVSRRPNGDFIELAKGKVEGGSITLRQGIQNGQSSGPADASISLGRFEGTVRRAQLTVPDGTGTAQLALRDSKLSGSVKIDDDYVRFAGDISLDGTLSDYDTGPSARGNGAHVDSAALKGQAKVTLDTREGVQLSGRAAVDVQAQGVDLGQRGLSIQDATAHVSGTADVKLDASGFSLGNGDLKLSASARDGKVALGNDITLDLKAGTTVDAAIQKVVFGPRSVALDVSAARVEAELDGGQVRMPGGSALQFKDGAKLAFTLDRLSVPAEGTPSASGKMSLVADLGAQEIDRASLARVPGLNLTSAQGVGQQLRVNVGRFDLQSTGRYEVRDLSVGIEARVDRLTGVIR